LLLPRLSAAFPDSPWDSSCQGVWLHIITPVQTATLIAGYGLLTQGYGIFKLRHTLNFRKA
jgi:hypothetical protein